MPNRPPEDDLKAIWLDQETETTSMSVEVIRARARTYVNRTRLRYIAGLAVVAFVAVEFAWFAWMASNPIIRLGDIMVVASTAWMVWRLWRRMPKDAPDGQAASSLVDHHRSELLRQRVGYLELLISAAPALAGCAVIVVGRQLQPQHANPLPVAVFAALWVVGGWLLARRHLRRIDQQLAELERIGRE